MTYILYGHRRSGSLAVEMALAEIGADFQVRDVDLEAEAQRGEDYASINPQRKVPALLTPSGETLTESGFCLTDLYIAVLSRWAQQDAWRPENVPKVERLTAAVAARPACAPVWSRHRPDVTPNRFG